MTAEASAIARGLHDVGTDHDMTVCGFEHKGDFRCALCRRFVGDGPDLMPSVLMSFEGRVVDVCDVCWDQGDDRIRSGLDYMTDEGDDDA